MQLWLSAPQSVNVAEYVYSCLIPVAASSAAYSAIKVGLTGAARYGPVRAHRACRQGRSEGVFQGADACPSRACCMS